MTENKDDLILENTKLVYHLLHRYYPNSVGDEDMVQVGMLALCRAAHNFEEGNCKFSTYASHCILNGFKAEFRERAKTPPNVSLSTVLTEFNDGDKITLEDTILSVNDVDYCDYDTLWSVLSPMERDVAKYRILGLQQKDIAKKLGVSRNAVSLAQKRIAKRWNKLI